MIGHLRQIICLVQGSRVISTTPILNQPKYTPKYNPGVHRRLKAIKKHEADVIEKSEIDIESLDEMEESLIDAHLLHDEVMSDMKQIRKRREFNMTERKYFRPPKEPSMLTWTEKEQIKFLNQSNPEKWTPEALAESFPASPTIIKKILRSSWKPLAPKRLKEYDETVSKNWIDFHRGQLEIHDLRLKQHLLKFTDRKNGVQIISDKDAKTAAEVTLPKPKNTEFLSLITSFKPKNEANDDSGLELIEDKSKEQNNKSKELSTIHFLKTNFTSEQLCERFDKNTKNIFEAPDDMKAILRIKPRSNEPTNATETNRLYMAPSERYLPNAFVTQKRNKSFLKLEDPHNLPDRIQIPKEKWKRGSTYRVDDSFYNDEGEFLYRVPGLRF